MKAACVAFLSDYAANHRNPRNKLTHFFGIPMIVVTLMTLLRPVHLFSVEGYQVDLAQMLIFSVWLFYVALNLWLAVGMALCFAVGYWLSGYFSTPIAWGVFIAGWILQFIGHRFEGKQPAFFRNVVHLLIGPLFIWNTALQKLKLPALKHN